MDRELFISLILKGEYNEAELYLTSNKINEDELENILMYAAYQENNISIYTFVVNLLLKDETAKLHQIACGLMSNPLCFIEGAYLQLITMQKEQCKLNHPMLLQRNYFYFFI